MKRTILILMCFIGLTNTTEALDSKIAQTFDKFRYDMAVEWDQKDPYFKEHIQRELEEALVQLQKEGVTTEQIIKHMSKCFLDEKTSKEFGSLVAAMKKQGPSEEEPSDVAMKFVEKNYDRGDDRGSGARRSWRKMAVGVVTSFVIKHWKRHLR